MLQFSAICKSFLVPNPLHNQSDFLKYLWPHDFVQDKLDPRRHLKMIDKPDWCIMWKKEVKKPSIMLSHVIKSFINSRKNLSYLITFKFFFIQFEDKSVRDADTTIRKKTCSNLKES